MRIRARTDKNQANIVKEARKLGASVAITSQLGKGFPDIVIGHQGKNYLIEIKDGESPSSAQRLTPDEAHWHAAWRGSVHIIKDPSELKGLL